MEPRPLTAPEFAARMAALGPFESHPALAVAVSGGGDSMALCLLAHDWARARGGAAVALTVDHGLRANSATEARRVGAWLRQRGIRHQILRWRGAKPRANVQAVARAARLELLAGRCARAGWLHLLLAHHRADQAETFLLRLCRGSGVDGLAAMAGVNELGAVRLLRPLLDVPPDRLVATLRAAGQAWVDDPSNRDPAFARVRLRAGRAVLAREGLGEARLAATARRMGRARAALDADTAALLARAASVLPAGYGLLDAAALAAAPEETGLRALGRVLCCIGGAAYAPRLVRLERAGAAIAAGRACTLGGCRILPPTRRTGGSVLVCRELAAVGPAVAATAGRRVRWDGRFELVLGPRTAPGLRIDRLGRDGWAQVAAAAPGLRATPVPPPARPVLPALWRGGQLVSVPHLGPGAGGVGEAGPAVRRLRFRPPRPLAGAAFAVV